MSTETLPLRRVDATSTDEAATLLQRREDIEACELAAEVAACIPALPVLQTQLREAVKTVEDSVVDVCGTFMSIAQQARAAVAAGASGSEGSGGETSMAQMMGSCSQAFDGLLEHIERSSQIVQSTSARLAEVETGMKQVAALLSRIDDLARDVYVIALNGTIEAARAGEQGKAFGVVAQHTRQLATTARLTSEDIRAIVVRVSRQATETSQTLTEQAAEDQRCVGSSRSQAASAMQQLTHAHDQMSDAMQQSQAANSQLASSISRAVTTMQFQDAVAQRIGHVAATLGEMQQALQTKLSDLGTVDSTNQSRWIDHMASQYVMQAERSVIHQDPSSATVAAASSDLGDNIELF